MTRWEEPRWPHTTTNTAPYTTPHPPAQSALPGAGAAAGGTFYPFPTQPEPCPPFPPYAVPYALYPPFWGPFQPSYPVFFPPQPSHPPLGLADHRDRDRDHHHHRRQFPARSRSRSPTAHGPDLNDPSSASTSAPTKPSRRPPAHVRHREERRSRPPRDDVSDEPAEPEAATHAPDGSYLPPARRQRRDTRHATVLPPTATYLAAAATAAATAAEPYADHDDDAIALVMDLNHTLLCRAKRNRHASKMPVVRPYLATFLTYICTPRPTDPRDHNDDDDDNNNKKKKKKKKFAPIVYSSARAPNVLSMLAALNLIPPDRLGTVRFRDPYEPDPTRGDVLEMVFTREMMGLSERDYAGDVETVKDLGKVWERLGWAGDGVAVRSSTPINSGAGGENAAFCEDTGRVSSEEEEGAEAPTTATGTGTGPATGTGTGTGRPKLNRKAKARLAARRDTIGARRTLLLDDEAGKAVEFQPPFSGPRGSPKFRFPRWTGASVRVYRTETLHVQAQQPYSHLPIAPFLLHPSEIPDRAAVTLPLALAASSVGPPDDGGGRRASRGVSPYSAPTSPPSASGSGSASAPPRTAFYDPTAVALQVEACHPPAHDAHLLSTIWVLERLSSEPNLAYAIKNGALDRFRDDARRAVRARKSGLEGPSTAATAEEVEEEGAADVQDQEVDDEMARRGIAVCEQLGITVSREWVPDWREKLLATTLSPASAPCGPGHNGDDTVLPLLSSDEP